MSAFSLMISACFRTDGNSESVMDVIKLECKKLANTTAFSLLFLERISVSWHDLETSRFKISLNISSLATSENEKAYFSFPSFHTSPIVIILGCFLYFTVSWIIGSLILSEMGSLVTYSEILRLPMFGKFFWNWNIWKSFIFLYCYFFLGYYFVSKNGINLISRTPCYQ